jgi:curved DNA-binding protein CbpA
MDKDIFKDPKLLTRFIWKLQILPDTPALIQFVAGNEDYLALCSRIVNDSNEHSLELKLLKDICRKQEIDFQVLIEKLTPVARAFGLIDEDSNYYELLGISRDADTADIKKAFRRKVIEVHPDTSDRMSANSAEFINLQAAYQILSDPILRQQYDEDLADVSLWKEKANHTQGLAGSNRSNPLMAPNPNPNPSARTKIYYQLGGLFLLLVIAVFICDFVYQQNAMFDTDYQSHRTQDTKSETRKAGDRPNSNSNPAQQNADVKILPDGSKNSAVPAMPDDKSKPANIDKH